MPLSDAREAKEQAPRSGSAQPRSFGIGFTMAIFVSGLAFGTGHRLGVAKLAVLLGSLISALVAMAVGRLVLRPAEAGQIAATADEAEASTEYGSTGVSARELDRGRGARDGGRRNAATQK
ncbi:Na+/H+ antiporter NhaA [Sorangium sp. So ce1000]|uniref:Na+/H+ antiporter NhaA n=1 Tax=Sorangium sp. So ce1000 TaxID=3133325 RepID=UPI003F5D8BDF